ncbi:enoyl-CoA delta isomerase 3, peroxisomal [Pieris brassicae]|uniref:enoyl-CoA delta isomerase 3, peroxisomal n=1 Tax=Pieris brassicae TaxID=7116 RepID=UPI001E6627D7|nr:enoyl-CoA delta isomerase 3, peroxisomal [Pieris brassicae]
MSTLIVTRQNDIKVIKFNKPKKKNAIDYYMYIKVIQELDSAAADKSISMVVLSGTGDFYSSGNELGNNLDINQELLLKSVKNFIKAIILFPKLLVAVVNGPAIGIAATTLPFCDFVYASEKAYFYTPFTKLGLVAEACSTINFPRVMGDRLATKMLMLNYKMPAQEALKCGLVTEVYKREELETKAWENIENILILPLDSLLTTKKLVRRPLLQQYLETNEIEMQEVKRLALSKL